MNPIAFGAFMAALGVALGAFGAHGLKNILEPDALKVYETGTHYLMIHAFGLILLGLSKIKALWPSWLFTFGILLFTGSLYVIAFTGIRAFGMITPLGGLAFIAGWLGFAYHARKNLS